jgi:hypothetical protein
VQAFERSHDRGVSQHHAPPVSFTVAADDGPTARTGRITVRDKVVQIIQAGR